ncbi:hypothetical protein N9A94_06120 [Akkermansiaceae bacterium]|nr:hypothetical protein [Akkermansiaceae bacterium]MDB4537752.1 hypothetical protein [Akkermansiaceae bacterium]
MQLIRLLLLPLFALSLVEAQEKDQTPEELYFEELVGAYNFVVVQEEALKMVARQHPDLASDVDKIVEEQKKSSFGTAVAALRKDLSERLGDKWKESEEILRKQIIKNDLSVPFTKEKAQTMVKQYAKVKDGLVPTDTLRIIISLHPEYIEVPTKEIEDGWLQPVEKKSADKIFSMFFPGSWKPREMKNPRNLVGAVHKAGYGICTISLTAIPVAPQLYEQEYAKYSPIELAKLLIPKNTKIDSTIETDFVGAKGGFSIYDIPEEGKPKARIMQYAAYQEEHFVLLQLTMTLKENHDVDYLTKKFKPVLIRCANSLLIK